jgi:hypothetical protein
MYRLLFVTIRLANAASAARALPANHDFRHRTIVNDPGCDGACSPEAVSSTRSTTSRPIRFQGDSQ